MLVMQAMRADPFDGAALPIHGAEQGEKILDHSWRSEAAMRQQTVKAQTDAQSAAKPPQDEGQDEPAP